MGRETDGNYKTTDTHTCVYVFPNCLYFAALRPSFSARIFSSCLLSMMASGEDEHTRDDEESKRSGGRKEAERES